MVRGRLRLAGPLGRVGMLLPREHGDRGLGRSTIMGSHLGEEGQDLLSPLHRRAIGAHKGLM